MNRNYVRGLIALAVMGLALATAPFAAAASSIVECGQVVAYTGPDPGTPADGSLTLGNLTPWVIDADAVVSAAIAATLPSFAGSGPSCVALDLDDGGVVTSIDFASEGTVTGPVVFDSGMSMYVFHDRIIIPTFVTDAYPGLAAVFATSAAAGTDATATFTVDVTSGQFTGVTADAAFCGPGDLAGNGDGLVGDAVIPAAVLDAKDRAALADADLEEACAVVHVEGTIGNTGLAIETDVEILFTPNTATDVRAQLEGAQRSGWAISLLAVIAATVAAGAAMRRTRPDSPR
jgi:hypothetical protein